MKGRKKTKFFIYDVISVPKLLKKIVAAKIICYKTDLWYSWTKMSTLLNWFSLLISNTSWAKFLKINCKWMKITTMRCCITKYPLVCKWDGNLRVIWCDAVVSFLWLDRDWRAPLGFPWGWFYPVGHVMDFLLQWKTSDPYVCFALHMYMYQKDAYQRLANLPY